MEPLNAKVLIIDDAPQDIKMVMECLKNEYTLIAATSGEKGIELAYSNKPDIVLMDVSMPSMNGYEACRHILKEIDTRVIFLSANNTTEEILTAYEAGGIDYIIKPFSPPDLLEKIKKALVTYANVPNTHTPDSQSLLDDSSSKMLLHFTKASLENPNADKLAHQIIEFTQDFGLNASVQLHSASGIYEQSSSGQVASLESEIMTRILQEDGRIFKFHNRQFITYDNIALLVKNMPTSDDEKPKKLTKNLSEMIECANTMLLNIDRISSINDTKNREVQATVLDLTRSIARIQQHIEQQKEHKKFSMKIMDEMLANMETSFVNMGLTYNQEQELLGILNHSIDKSVKHFESGANIDEQFESIIKDVTALIDLHR